MRVRSIRALLYKGQGERSCQSTSPCATDNSETLRHVKKQNINKRTLNFEISKFLLFLFQGQTISFMVM